jgi:hypothetical protein
MQIEVSPVCSRLCRRLFERWLDEELANLGSLSELLAANRDRPVEFRERHESNVE